MDMSHPNVAKSTLGTGRELDSTSSTQVACVKV